VVWPYSYSYFNLLNLDNLVRYIGPSYDGGAFLSLAPNFVKAMLSIESSRESALEVSNFNVSSAIADLYGDSGYLSIVVVATIAGIAGQRIFHGWLRRFDVRALFVYSVLYFCALFSFFVNFWFYLPIIFQVVFVYGLLGKKGGRITSSTVSREWIKGSLLATSRENTASPGAGAG
jgi:oligosaccharide repeat unit polymerase